MKITQETMIQALPIAEAIRKFRKLANDMKSAGASVISIFELERLVRALEEGLDDGLEASPTCGTREAAEIIGVSPRQARYLAGDPESPVRATQSAPRRRLTFDVRSLYAHLAGQRRAA